ncbi:MAG: hypothetical protein KDA44_12230 [Planctomycetales bacterium]|nr:hypothetical protein [Planctomycetales bacterium]
MPVPSMNRDPLLTELTRFPKAPVDEIVTSVGAQSKAIVAAGVAMLLAAAALYGESRIATAQGAGKLLPPLSRQFR